MSDETVPPPAPPSAPPSAPLPPWLSALRWLVMTLLAVMIAGFVLLIIVLLRLLNADPLPLPEALALPEGAEAAAVTLGPDWIGIVTADDRILILDRASGAVRQTIVLD